MSNPFTKFRKTRKLSKAQAAAICGVNRSTYLRWESGEAKVSIDNLAVVEMVTGIPRKKLRPDIFMEGRT